jgi:hypothetical protein
MKISDMLECKGCHFSNACDMCGVAREKKLLDKLSILCEDSEKVEVRQLTVNYLIVEYTNDVDGKCTTLTSHKDDLTDDKIDNEAICLMDELRKLYKET